MDILYREMVQEDVPYIKKLYEDSFPASEKKPLEWMMDSEERMLVVMADQKVCGLLFTLEDETGILIDYFAIDGRFRQNGVGSRVLGLYLEQAGKPVILEIEDPGSASNEQERKLRLRRKDFYLRGGLKLQDYRVDLFGVRMEMLATIDQFTYNAYVALLKNCLFEGVENHVSKV